MHQNWVLAILQYRCSSFKLPEQDLSVSSFTAVPTSKTGVSLTRFAWRMPARLIGY
jgi:hypothetical protein